FPTRLPGIIGGIEPRLPRGFLRPIHDLVACDFVEPCREWNPAPFETADILKRQMKYLGGQILGFVAGSPAADDESLDAFEVAFVKLGEAARVALRRLDLAAFVSRRRTDLQCRSPAHHRPNGINHRPGKRLRGGQPANSGLSGFS